MLLLGAYLAMLCVVGVQQWWPVGAGEEGVTEGKHSRPSTHHATPSPWSDAECSCPARSRCGGAGAHRPHVLGPWEAAPGQGRPCATGRVPHVPRPSPKPY